MGFFDCLSSPMPISFALQVQGAQQVKGQLNGVGGSMRQLGKEAGVAAQQAPKVQRNYSQAALGISAVATSATATVFSFQNLQKSTVAVADAERDIIEKHRALGMAQHTLNKMVDDGKEGTVEYEFALQDLDSKTRDYATSQEKLKLAQQDANAAQIQFGLSIIPTVLTSVIGLRGSISSLNLGLRTTGTVAAPVASQGVRKFGFATRLAQLAMGPFGIAMLAIGAVFTAVATNAFGLRDAMDSFAKKVEQVFPFLKPVFDFFRGVANAIFPDTEEASKDMATQINTDMDAMSSTISVASQDQAKSLGITTDAFKDVNEGGSGNIKELADNVDDAADGIVRDASRIKDSLDDIGVSAPSAKDIFPSATTPSVETPPPPKTPEQEQEEKKQTDRLTEIAEELRVLEQNIRPLGGRVLSIQDLKERGFGGVPNELGAMLREHEELLGEREQLQQQREETGRQANLEAIRAQFAGISTPSSALSGMTFEELVRRGMNQINPPLAGLGTGVPVVEGQRADITTFKLDPKSAVELFPHMNLTNPFSVEVNVQLDGKDIAANVDSRTRSSMGDIT